MNMQALMQQAQKMQRDIQKKQAELESMTFEGKYEFVSVTFNGKREMLSCNITKDAVDMDDLEMLQDFIVLATNDSMKKIEKEYDQKMGQYSGMLNGLM